jgi:hypothetical protein
MEEIWNMPGKQLDDEIRRMMSIDFDPAKAPDRDTAVLDEFHRRYSGAIILAVHVEAA